MNNDFPLLRQLHHPQKADEDNSPLPKGIKYQERTVIVENVEVEIFIPSREAASFDQTIREFDKPLDKHEFNTLLRKYRGIRNWK